MSSPARPRRRHPLVLASALAYSAAFGASFTLLGGATALAQVVGGTMTGTVLDPTGAVVPGAKVVVRNTDTGTVRTLVSDPGGRFSAPSIPVGTYTITADTAGFAPYQRTGVQLTVGQSLDLALKLALTGSETVTVNEALPTVNTSTEQTSGLIDARQIKELPLNGRSYDQLITLNPGTVNYSQQRSGSVGTSNSSVGNMFAVAGRRPQDNLFLLNGIEYTGASLINNTPGGTSGQLLGIDGVREFNVVSDSYSAAYGKREGAQISIVTASGTNQVHGSAYEFLRNSYFDSRNYFDQARIPEFQRNDFGGALGGPLRKNKLFLFGNYEGYRQNLGLSDVTLVPDNTSRAAAVASVRPLLNLWPVANGPEIGGGIAEAFSSPTQHIREDFGTTRFDANLTPNDLFFAAYTVDDSDAHTPTQDPYSLIDEYLREQVLSAQEQHVFSPRLLNTVRFGYSRASFLFLGSVPSAIQADTTSFVSGRPTGAVVIAGSTASNGASQVTTAGANVGSNNAITRNLFTFDDHVFYTRGKHQIEAGVWLQRLQSNDNLAQNQYGQASFASLQTFLAGNIKTFTVVPQPTELGWRSLFAAAYLEDTYHVTSRLEIRAGFRSEDTSGWNESQGRAGVYTFTNGVINTNPLTSSNGLTTNRALFLPEPRAGLAWNVFGNGTTSVRASVGLHHSLLDTLDYRFDQSAPFNTTLSYSNTTVAAPTSGTPSISPSTVQSDMSTPAVVAYTLRLEQQLARSTSLTVGYIGSHAYHQILSADLNEPAFVVCPNPACPAADALAAGTIFYPNATKLNPALANTTSWYSGGSANYNGLIVDVRHDLYRGLQMRANYTWSKNLDDGSAWNTSVSANTPAFVSVPQLPHLDYGPSAFDVRHLFAVNGTYDLPFGNGQAFLSKPGGLTGRLVSGWQLATIANLQTGFPFSPQLGYNPTNSGDTRNPVRPNVNPNFHGNVYIHGTTSERVAQFFNPTAFTPPATGAVGNERRDTLVGPGYADWDLSLLKSTQLAERMRLQFRAEIFNVLNHTNLQTPNEVVYTSATQQSPTAGVITATAGTSRQIQLGLKLLF
ncbi:MAG: carboxypeptidase regulatory-like domain-containing protein [Janthinobacterium lividum]